MSFATQFWTSDYANGLQTLFKALNDGVEQNNLVLMLIKNRADVEEAYGLRLKGMTGQSWPCDMDIGTTVTEACRVLNDEMAHEGSYHLSVAQNMRSIILGPFKKWSDEHRSRLERSQDLLTKKTKIYEREYEEVNRSQKRYFNKCRVLEDVKEAKESSGDARQISQQESSNDDKSSNQLALEDTSISSITSEELSLGGYIFSFDDAQELVARMLQEIPKQSLKVPILGTYKNVSSGSAITQWFVKNLEYIQKAEDPFGLAERAGQDLISAGIIKVVAQVGSKFANSSVLYYQWKPRAWSFAGIGHATFGNSIADTLGHRFSEYLTARPTDPTKIDDAQLQRLVLEVRELDQKYKKDVAILDNVRCELEELIVEHLKFLEDCERNRRKVLKAVLLDFLAAISNVVPSIQASVEKLLNSQESIDPESDIMHIIEQFQTGKYLPKVVVYDNYYSSIDGNTFGMDLELRTRGDGKPVPYVISTILRYLDSVYPLIENDEIRLSLWTIEVPIKITHALRREINKSAAFNKELLASYEPPVLIAGLKLYLTELPNSLIPDQFYDVLNKIYLSHSGPENREIRFKAIENTLSRLRVANIATLDVLTAHIYRVITIANASQSAVELIAKELGPLIIRSSDNSKVSLTDTMPTQLTLDLLNGRNRLFAELKRRASGSYQNVDEVNSHKDSIVERVNSIALHSRDKSVHRKTSPQDLSADTQKSFDFSRNTSPYTAETLELKVSSERQSESEQDSDSINA